MVKAFDGHYDSFQYTLDFYLVDHMMEDIEKFGSLEMLDSFPFERFNEYTKFANRPSSQS